MLVTIEGIDGSGKTTLHKALGPCLSDLDPVITCEPGSTWIGEAVRRAIREQSDPIAEALLFVADHAAHLREVVKPALAEGRLVISDRYIDSRLVYQQVTLDGIILDPLSWLRSVHNGWTIMPDLTILLAVPVSVALERTGRRESGEHFEQEPVLTRVYEYYMQLVEEDKARFLILDGTLPPEHILKVAAGAIRYRHSELKKGRSRKVSV
ncbi:MAG TPA: dTMP kinase [Methanospirillum sp.]|nr:dTMP kinase [Methanospirillum sp.]HPY59658.1 dTMP kinase [Methanospirillum sp.]